MNYKEHFTLGLAVTLILSIIAYAFNLIEFSIYLIPILIIISFVYALLPDLDIGTSKIRQVFMILLSAFGIYSLIYLSKEFAIAILIFFFFLQFTKHRGRMHNILVGAGCSAVLYFLFYNWFFPVIAFANFLSHLIADEVNL
jgi:membrane-bound metal-dependent hydrolase YbcI (DUF457 family)